MKNAEHTPGPWSYNRDEGGMHGHVISTGEYVICELPDAGDGASPHTEANARLIAAAPGLLEAAKQAMQALQREYDKYDNCQWHDPDCRDAYIALRDAVTAAKEGAI
jgi:hypothetical protein